MLAVLQNHSGGPDDLRQRALAAGLLELAGKASQGAGTVMAIDNRLLARTARLAGAPKTPAAGMVFHAPLGTLVAVGQPLFTLHAGSPGELAYALAYAQAQDNLVTIGEAG